MRRLAFVILAVVACGKRAPASRDDARPAPPPAADAAETAPDAAPPTTPTSPPVDTTTGASPTWTPGPPVVVGDTVDGAALRAENRARLAADR